jgi:hypothetical protein
VRDKKIEFEGSSKNRDISITKTKPLVRSNLFSEKEG